MDTPQRSQPFEAQEQQPQQLWVYLASCASGAGEDEETAASDVKTTTTASKSGPRTRVGVCSCPTDHQARLNARIRAGEWRMELVIGPVTHEAAQIKQRLMRGSRGLQSRVRFAFEIVKEGEGQLRLYTFHTGNYYAMFVSPSAKHEMAD